MQEIGKTEVIKDTLNPKFLKTFIVPYNFEQQQRLRFEIFDIDSFENLNNLEKQDFIGYMECDLNEIVCSPTKSIMREIQNNRTRRKRNGSIFVRGVEADTSSNKIGIHFGARDIVTKNDLLLKLYISENRQFLPLYASEVIKNQKKGIIEWKKFYLAQSKIPDETTLLKLEVLEAGKSRVRNQIGDSEFTLQHLLENNGRYVKLYKNGFIVGEIKLIEIKKEIKHTFLNYVYAGYEINLIIGLDFTKSNKDPSDPQSLHYVNDNEQLNEYQQALKTIVGILQNYDNDNRIPVYGFGSKLPPTHHIVSHCFALNGNYFEPEVCGLEEVIDVYQDSLQCLMFHGPTIFSEIVKLAAEYAESEQEGKYYILLIITDGNINDMSSTIDEIVKASRLPLSIIIIGVGNEDFSQMKILDSDDKLLYSEKLGISCERDIVQFVPFQLYKSDPHLLAMETLAEVPKQFLEYMEKYQNVPLQVNINNNKQKQFTTQDFIHSKVEDQKKKILREILVPPKFLQNKKIEFFKQILDLGYDQDIVKAILDDGIPAPDINLVTELMTFYKKAFEQQEKSKKLLKNGLGYKSYQQQEKIKKKIIKTSLGGKLDEEFKRKKNENYSITKGLLEDLEKRQYYGEKSYFIKDIGFKDIQEDNNNNNNTNTNNNSISNNNNNNSKSLTALKSSDQLRYSEYSFINNIGIQSVHQFVNKVDTREYQQETNVCILCRKHKISIIFMPCGHALTCNHCKDCISGMMCYLCKMPIRFFYETNP